MYDSLELLQFDTNTTCNSHCHYCECHHKRDGSVYNHQMPMELIEKILSQFDDHPLWRIQPWFRGEPLLEPRMPEILKLIRNHQPKAEIVFFTNATIYEKRELLMQVDRVDITLSAAIPETYEIIAGTKLYSQAVKTIEWLEQQPNHPKIILRFVATDWNAHEITQWKEQWKRFTNFQNIATHYLLAGWKPSVPLDGELEQMKRGDYAKGTPCLFWNMMLIDVFGNLYQCCRNATVWGNVKDTPIAELWAKRIENKQQTIPCQRCPVNLNNMRKWGQI